MCTYLLQFNLSYSSSSTLVSFSPYWNCFNVFEYIFCYRKTIASQIFFLSEFEWVKCVQPLCLIL